MIWAVSPLSDFSHEMLQATYAAMSDGRRARVDKQSLIHKKKESLAAECLLRQLLQTHYGLLQPLIDTTPAGAPFLVGEKLFVSLSHSEHFVAAAVSESPVGVDVEEYRPVSKSLVQRVCQPAEADFVFGQEGVCDGLSDKQIPRFFAVWTAKEACFKALGSGIGGFENLLSCDSLLLQKEYLPLEDAAACVVQL